MLETYPLFQGDRMKATNTKSIPTNDKSSFTSLITLYECHLELFQLYFYGTTVTANKVKNTLKKRPDDNTINSFISYLTAFWDSFAWVYGNARVYGDADYIVFKNWWSSGRYFTWTRSNNKWRVGCFLGTGEELIAKAYKDSEKSGRNYERIVKYVESILADENNEKVTK